MLRLRLITGPLLIVGLLVLVWVDGLSDGWFAARWPSGVTRPQGVPLLLLFALLIVPLAAIELAALLRASGIRAPRWLIVLAAELGLFAGSVALTVALDPTHGADSPWPGLVPLAAAAVPTALVILAAIAVVALAWGQRIDGVVAGVGAALMASVVLGLLPAFFIALRQEHGPALIVGIMLTTKSCDIGAYFVGRALGRNKLIPWLSPGKTWEGLVGGVLIAGVIGGLLAWWTQVTTVTDIPVAAGIVGGLLLGLGGQAGDLIESLLKRGANAKDSGRTLPGMGGILDVIDSLVPAGPIAAAVLLIATR